MKTIQEILEEKRLQNYTLGSDGGRGYIRFLGTNKLIAVQFSWGDDWDHVSASFKNRCPEWNEMCVIKDIFFKLSETVIQYHPDDKNYKNTHPYCLHLWRPQKLELPKPPNYMI